ncbi:hypothetical protein ACO229_09695 [Promicromonospora sp. MS192]|uniref:hypothetical protein n=1 Tax=Promicromonospora sp. MS192 TaxID=3412684 RepID=UPI003C2BEDC1
MASLDELIDAGGLVPPADAYDWEQAEATLQVALPEDYRALVDAGGAGLWFDYVRVYAPGERYEDRNLLDSLGVFEDLKIFWDNGFSYPPEDIGEDTKLIAWASTGTGATLFWRVDPGVAPASYPLYVQSADGDWERLEVTTTDFLRGVQQGTVGSEYFSEAFLDRTQTFRPYPG